MNDEIGFENGKFVLRTPRTFRSRWIKYGGHFGWLRCTFCNEWFEPGDWYYRNNSPNKSHPATGSFCVGHAAFLFSVAPPR